LSQMLTTKLNKHPYIMFDRRLAAESSLNLSNPKAVAPC
jgi:hypothetical protein